MRTTFYKTSTSIYRLNVQLKQSRNGRLIVTNSLGSIGLTPARLHHTGNMTKRKYIHLVRN